MEHEELTHKIIGCAYTVFNKLGFGFLESIYRKAMVIELTRAGLKAEEEKPLGVYYDEGEELGVFSADLFVEDTVVVELKSVQHTVIDHEVQLVNYLNALRKDIGLLINFGPSGVEVKRKYREFKAKEE
jgi:GxxExxY protein